MAITAPYEFTSTLALNSELSLTGNSTTIAALTTPGVFQVFIDFSNAAANDSFLVTIYEKAISASTQRRVQTFTIGTAAVLANPLWCSCSLVLMRGYDLTVTQTAGTGRVVSWSVRQVA